MVNDDIVTTLRGECQCSDNCRDVGDPCISMRAADEIERLRATLKKAEVVLLEGAELVKDALADRDRWKNWAIDYACDDTKCECDRCLAVRAAWEAAVNGDR